MLSDEEKTRMQTCLRTLREAMPGFASRRAQLVMMAEVAHVLGTLGDGREGLAEASQRIGVIEAGTGTGKTLGYLLPAIVLARSRGLRVVVSSSTVALQEQLMAKDLPALQRHLPVNFTSALAKGRRRYVCPAKLLRLDAQRSVASLGGEVPTNEARPATAQPVRLEGRLAQAFARGTWSGDRDDWQDPIPEGLWHRLSTDRDGCLGARCEEFGRCPFQAARQRLKDADVVVANHDLLLAALDMEPGALLPDLPGAYCTHLVVAKLPFAVPDDPVEQTRREWIEAQGRSAFHERSVPEVGIRLAQAVGRLLRTPQDHGRVTVLDPRLAGTAWGRRLLDGLPPYRRVRGRALGVPLGATPGVHAVA